MQRGNLPFKHLGSELAKLRSRVQESLLEVSGAIEVDSERLVQYENGELRPSEDILQLIIAHFDVKEDEATRLWQLAGYDQDKTSHSQANGNDEIATQTPTIMLMPVEARIIYTDMVKVTVNNYGVVINFLQGNGPNIQPLPVTRVGMSLEHAKSVLEVMQKTINKATQASIPKLLPSPKNSSNKKRK